MKCISQRSEPNTTRVDQKLNKRQASLQRCIHSGLPWITENFRCFRQGRQWLVLYPYIITEQNYTVYVTNPPECIIVICNINIYIYI